jgi:hypothetical protein
MKLVDPVVTARRSTASLAPRLDTLHAKRIGLWANMKLNSYELLSEVENELRSRYEIGAVIRGTYIASRIMQPDEWGDIDSCDAVILANGDCGSCSSSGLLNQAAIEQRGIPAMLIGTNRFRAALEATRKISGIDNLRWAEVPHPIGSLNREELRLLARDAIDQFESIVLDKEL